jgi:peptidoglycan hydrolase CwlO-like protein
MCKKLGIAFVAVLVGVVALRAMPWTGSHVRLWFKELRESVRKEVKPEREIARLKMEVQRLEVDIKKQRSAIAEAADDFEDHKRAVAKLEAELSKKGERVLTLREDLKKAEKDGTTFLVYGGNRYDKATVKADLEDTFRAYTALEKRIDAEKKMLKAREFSLTKAREQYNALVNARDELSAELIELEAQLKSVRAAQTQNKTYFDSSKLGRIKEDLEKAKKRVRIMEREAAMESEPAKGKLPEDLKAKPAEDVFQKISNHPVLGKTHGDKVVGK